MLLYNELPVILVSAVDTTTAAGFISELIDDEVKHVEAENEDVTDRVWRMTNKYYTAEVRLHPVGDEGQGIELKMGVEAHVIHLAAGEGEPEARRRRARAHDAGAAPDLLVAAGEWARVPPALAQWAAAQRADAVPLLERAPTPLADEAGAPFAESYGVQRVRDALHAHAWRGLRRHRSGAAWPSSPSSWGGSEGDSSDAADEEGEEAEEGAVERAEAFALALGALRGARDSPADDATRRARAEHLAAAFARALGLDPRDC